MSGRTGHDGAVRVVRLSENPALRPVGSALVQDYLRLPDAWGGHTPDLLPASHQAVIDGYPGEARPPRGDALIAEAAGTVAGQVLVGPHDADAAKLERMYVVEQARGQGLGALLLHEALELAKSLAYRRVVLDVMPERLSAITLYESFGFAPIEPYADYGCPMAFLGREV